MVLRNSNDLSMLAFELAKRTTMLGRDRGCDVVVDHPSVSRFHAELRVDDWMVTVHDLGSKNGTFVDGSRVETAIIRAGQAVQFGTVAFELDIPTGKAPEVTAAPETATVSNVFAVVPPDQALGQLSVTERRVFDLIMRGKTEKEVARQLGVSPHTVHAHVRQIYRAFGVHSRAELLAGYLPRLPKPDRSSDAPDQKSKAAE